MVALDYLGDGVGARGAEDAPSEDEPRNGGANAKGGDDSSGALPGEGRSATESSVNCRRSDQKEEGAAEGINEARQQRIL